MKTITHLLRGIWNDRFKRYVSIALAIVAAVVMFTGSPVAEPPPPPVPDGDELLEVHFFYHPGCPACRAQESFNEEMALKYEDVYFIYHDGSDPGKYSLLVDKIEDTNLTEADLDFPVTIVGNRGFVGWTTRDASGERIERAIIDCLEGNCVEPGVIEEEEAPSEVTVPVFGTIRFADYSLAGLAVILGLVDGFNPCAMWVLVYLISILLVLNDRRKAWIIVGAFVFASFILNYLFMTAWLNAFLLIGYARPVTIIIGAVALGAGIFNIYDYIKPRGQIVCEVVDPEERKSTMSRIESIAASPITAGMLISVIALAFIVNSFEFVCSAALPAIFTRVLTLAGLTTMQYYLYIFLYVFFLMLDHLIIFSAAVLALNTSVADRYMKYCRPIGGTILLILGVMLLFAPHVLQ